MHLQKYFFPTIALLLGLALGATLIGLFMDTDEGQSLTDSLATTTIESGDSVATSTPLPGVSDVVPPSDVMTDPETPASSDDMVACTMDAKLCPDGVTYVGRVAPNCAFAPCPDPKPTVPTEIVCTPEQKQSDVCIEIYAPVCASVQVECIKAPCEPVKQTYPNSCYACREDRVISYTGGGACPGDPVSE